MDFFKIRLWFRIYGTDYLLDSILSCCIKSGIAKITTPSKHNIEISFNNGVKVIGWNCNLYYAWFSEGCFKFPDGSVYQWFDRMPSRKTLYRLLKQLKKKRSC